MVADRRRLCTSTHAGERGGLGGVSGERRRGLPGRKELGGGTWSAVIACASGVSGYAGSGFGSGSVDSGTETLRGPQSERALDDARKIKVDASFGGISIDIGIGVRINALDSGASTLSTLPPPPHRLPFATADTTRWQYPTEKYYEHYQLRANFAVAMRAGEFSLISVGFCMIT
ncbi:uncharacterized protein F4807DRAFT_458692 [Annulohypoxylon truncatum]|uniref:uncharacterized protein n=1 Tax=Annulohypoxylon truncatum TaxID=327061 RepID=UPI0020082E7F|nr:uncharacterized protein F4807DRAFT_458692 [Annulohypoxylon truncatum]KAI1211120.1 hypothetical protein F4807DRAFT_458692 [Annulohypoxylon truncatum]